MGHGRFRGPSSSVWNASHGLVSAIVAKDEFIQVKPGDGRLRHGTC